jgi:hypothetical protein
VTLVAVGRADEADVDPTSDGLTDRLVLALVQDAQQRASYYEARVPELAR